MIYALVHTGTFHGWYKINYYTYELIKNPVRGRELFLLPTITAIMKVK